VCAVVSVGAWPASVRRAVCSLVILHWPASVVQVAACVMSGLDCTGYLDDLELLEESLGV
jgi:hypothetical protein